MGLRLLLPARKSRKGDEDSQFVRQEARNRERAEKEGHTIIHTTRDVVSSQTMPWERKELKSWMTDTVKLAMYDGILVETDRLARCDDKGWHYIEHWCYENGKVIITAEGVQFPARDASDKYQWIGLKDRARTYWEDVRDKHAGTREIIKANGGAIGRAPFGYVVTGVKLHKIFTIDPVWGPVVQEAYRRIKEGHTATSVAIWLTEVTGRLWRIRAVTEMIKRRTYLGERDGFTFEPLVTQEVWDQANNALATRSFTKPAGRRGEYGYSGLIFCACGGVLYRHQHTRNGKTVGAEKYLCSKGRSGDVTEERCKIGSLGFSEANKVIDQMMIDNSARETVTVTVGGDYGRQMELGRLQDEMKEAMSRMDMEGVTRIAAAVTALQGMPVEDVKVEERETGKTWGKVWEDGDLSDRRAFLARISGYRVVVLMDGDGGLRSGVVVM